MLALEDHRHGALAHDVISTICSHEGDTISAVVAHAGTALLTIEATINRDRDEIVDDTLRVFRVDSHGRRSYLGAITPDDGDDYDSLAWLLEEGLDALSRAT